jgi:tRNA U38,U39,U40 pseudouridine synthase TruA
MDIRIFSIMRVAKSFDMRHDALTRVYNYIIPLYIFQKYEDFKSGKIPSPE